MEVCTVPEGTKVALKAIPTVVGIVLRHGPMASVMRLLLPPDPEAGRPFPRSETGLWSPSTEVTILKEDK